ncbi:hypothetical protein CIL05_03155 [Virgibacillus profundi]|uniref:DUF3298 domain-containing protein n=1 Tax=Virgibacillus profundi TaxID=2024555 RepID=A0A2A2IG45_9BACI|nr:DUF3298 and DUF4163 domain-containing protein [Virgibacillus profundi]PAV30739.1 hypothetical protein CIL05_03155 [Virgibacillus profundi]PXY54923.1 DUF3298/DUF4163 domain-containing protein [Virgibacillus profundi]
MLQQPAIIQPRSYIDNQRNIQVYYPVVTGLNNPSIQHHINQTIMAHLNQLLTEWNFYEPTLVEMQSWFEIKTNERGILSLALYVYSFSGGAHGMTVIDTLTFDVTTGKRYTLDELFKPDSNYQQVLLDMIKSQVKERDIPVINEPIVLPGNENFYIADKSLVLYYQLYDLAPYYFGISYFPISVYAISDIIDEDGPLGEMLGSF